MHKIFWNTYFWIIGYFIKYKGIIFQFHNCVSGNLGTMCVSGLRILFRFQKGGVMQVMIRLCFITKWVYSKLHCWKKFTFQNFVAERFWNASKTLWTYRYVVSSSYLQVLHLRIQPTAMKIIQGRKEFESFKKQNFAQATIYIALTSHLQLFG